MPISGDFKQHAKEKKAEMWAEIARRQAATARANTGVDNTAAALQGEVTDQAAEQRKRDAAAVDPAIAGLEAELVKSRAELQRLIAAAADNRRAAEDQQNEPFAPAPIPPAPDAGPALDMHRESMATFNPFAALLGARKGTEKLESYAAQQVKILEEINRKARHRLQFGS